MKRTCPRPWLALAVLLLGLLLAACIEIEGGVEQPTAPGVLVQATATATTSASPTSPDPASASTSTSTISGTTTATATTSITSSGTAFHIGLPSEPADLLPYHHDAADERSTGPISELLMPAPLLAHTYTYTTTGVLERVPSFANGDIELRPVEVFLDPVGAISPEATDVVTTAQQIVITYHWNPDLSWSDGTPLTAADSLFAYELARQAPLGEAAQRRLRLLQRYEQVDDFTTRAYLNPDLRSLDEVVAPASEPDLSNAAALLTCWPPLPRHALETMPAADLYESTFALQPLSYGPYMIERREAGSLRLVRNPHYTLEPLPAADTISFRFSDDSAALRAALQNGSLDLVLDEQVVGEEIDQLEAAQAAGTLAVEFVPAPIWEHIDFNLNFAFFQDVRTRQAIIYGLDRDTLAESLYRDHVPVLHSWLLPAHWAAAPPEQLTTYAYDPEQARDLLSEAGLVDLDEDGIFEQGIDHDSDGELESSAPITLTLLTTEDDPLRARIAEQFQADMQTIGLRVTIQTTPTQELLSVRGPLFRRQFELTQFAWIASPDPRGFELWGCASIPSIANNWSGSNLPGWCTRAANQAIITATTTLDAQARRAAYREHQRLFSEELPSIPLFQRLNAVLYSPNLRGIEPDPLAPITWNIAAWSRN